MDAEYLRIKEIVEQTFKMEFVSDDQRKAVFANITGSSYPSGLTEQDKKEISSEIDKIKSGKANKKNYEHALKYYESLLSKDKRDISAGYAKPDKEYTSLLKRGVSVTKYLLNKYDEFAPK